MISKAHLITAVALLTDVHSSLQGPVCCPGMQGRSWALGHLTVTSGCVQPNRPPSAEQQG